MRVQYQILMLIVGVIIQWCSSDTKLELNSTKSGRDRRSPSDSTVCRVTISELNTDNPGPNQQQFIELEKKCSRPLMGKPPANPLKGYKLLFLRANPLAVVFALDFADDAIKYSEEHKKARFFVVGSKRVPHCLVDVQSSPAVESLIKNGDDIELLPTGDDSQYAVVLMYSSSSIPRREINLVKDSNGVFHPNTNIREPLFANMIKNHAKDMIIYGRKISSTTCTFFDSIWPDSLKNIGLNNYFFRDWDPQNRLAVDISINRCTDSTFGFLPYTFRLGKTTPGAENDCSGKMFYLESINFEENNNNNNIEVMDVCSNDNSDGVPTKRFRGVSEDAYHSYVYNGIDTAKTECSNQVENGLAFATQQMDIDVKNKLIKRLGSEPRPSDIQKHIFQEDWATKCRKYLPNGANVLEKSEIRKWLDIVVMPDKCMFSCYACKFFFKSGFRVDVKYKTNMQTSAGFFSTNPSSNLKQINEHDQTNVHMSAIKFLMDFSAARKDGEFLGAIRKAELQQHQAYLPTIRMVRLVYAEIIADVAFRKHHVFVDVVKSFDVNLGIHHYHPGAATDIMNIISTSFHETLINYLINENRPFSLIVDETTDKQNLSYMICYIQAFEDGYPFVYFYSLIYLKYGQNAEQLFRSFKEQIQLDNSINPQFETYFKTKLVALASDGASVMRGKTNSFWTKLSNYVERKIPAVHCLAHKAELSVKRALTHKSKTNFVYFQTFEKNINKFFVYYNSRGSKRWMHFKQVADELQLVTRRIRYHFDLRWSSSYFFVIKSLHDDLDALRLDLVAIEGDDSFTEAAKIEAVELHGRLTDKTYCICIMEYMDFLSVFKQISLNLQSSSGVLAGKYDIINKGIMDLKLLQAQPGSHVQAFLALVHCSDVCDEGTCSFQNYDECSSVVYKKVHANREIGPVVQVLTSSDRDQTKLSQLRYDMYESLITELGAYFDLDLLKSFEVFDPKKYSLPKCGPIPNQFDDTVDFDDSETDSTFQDTVVYIDPSSEAIDSLLIDNYDEKVRKICSFLEIEINKCTLFRAEWKVLMYEILTKVQLVKNFQEEDLTRFWPLALANVGLPWTNVCKEIIEKVLTVPFGSSDCERGFRYVTTLKANERSGLTPKNLEQLVRIKVNGPKDIKYFHADKYAEIYLTKHIRVDDESFRGGRRTKAEAHKSFARDSRLF